MDINTGIIALILVALGLHAAYAYFSYRGPEEHTLPWVPISVGKERSFVSQTRDASMYTESSRRKAIIRNAAPVYGYKGSTNGSLEWNFLTGICLCPDRACNPPYVIEDAGNADTEVCVVLDGDGGAVLDFGNANTNSCES